MAGIYIHIPFCRQACHYCDFHFSTSLSIRKEMVDAICKELKIRNGYLSGEEVSTIYFGGGTPSLLEVSELQQILDTVHALFVVAPDAEVTLEANPDDISLETARAWIGLGVNRLSIGIQSFDDQVLTGLNRVHDASMAAESFVKARAAGFANISIDLIYAIPGQSLERWKENIHRAIDLNPDHISSYSLTVEPKTVFGRRFEKGEFIPTPDDESADQLLALADILVRSGYHQYEVSNFGKPGFYSRHNSSYWQRQKYLGVGPSAHSYDRSSRHWNIRNNSLYIKGINAGDSVSETEQLLLKDHINDYLLTSLRTEWGADLQFLKNNFSFDLQAIYNDYVKQLVVEGYAVIEDHSLILTQKGKLIADKISSDLFAVD